MIQILAIVTAGGGQDLVRAKRLTTGLDASTTVFTVDKSVGRRESSRQIWRLACSEPWDLIYQEGTGIVGGLSLIRSARGRKQRYIVSSGDPIGGFFRTVNGRAMGAAFEVYERLLYRHCTGFVGWTPYLAGMALKMGARRAVTVEGAVDLAAFKERESPERRELKRRFGLDPDHIVCGVIGTINWVERQAYCYGLELVEMLKRAGRKDASVLIVGDGSGRSRLEGSIPKDLERRIVFTGRLPFESIPDAIGAMDIGFVTQTLDGLGSFRLTTKLPEYLACGVPVAMSPVPGFFDYASEAGWALPARHPGSAQFHSECAVWLDGLTRPAIQDMTGRARATAVKHFDYDMLGARFKLFVDELLSQSK